MKIVPFPACLSTEIFPPCASTIRLLIAKLMPIPFALVVNLGTDLSAKCELDQEIFGRKVFDRTKRKILWGLFAVNLVTPKAELPLVEAERALKILANIPSVVVLKGDIPIDKRGKIQGTEISLEDKINFLGMELSCGGLSGTLRVIRDLRLTRLEPKIKSQTPLT